MVKIYTKTGDDGTTGLIGNKRIRKSAPRIVAYGTVDELNSAIGIVRSCTLDHDINEVLTKIQSNLFVLGSDLANPNLGEGGSRITNSDVTYIENQIDIFEAQLAPITYFILPGGDSVSAHLHLARAICRRAEVSIVLLSESEQINNTCQVYVNRLADLLFVLARTINKRKDIMDTAWEK